MVLIITNNNNTQKIIRKYIDIKEVKVEKLKTKFDIYVDKVLLKKTLENFDRIIIDITNFNELKEEILNAITRIKVIYNIQIIIIALGYKIGDELLSNLFDIGIYDFVISENEEKQREECIKFIQKNNYIDAIKFKINKNDKKSILWNMNKNSKKIKRKQNKMQGRIDRLSYFTLLKNKLYDILGVVWYAIITLLVSVGATVLLNSNIRNIIFQIIKGGI